MKPNILTALFLLTMILSPQVKAKVLITQKEALEAAFPSGEQWVLNSETKYLTLQQLKSAKELSGHTISSALVVRHRAKNKSSGKLEFVYTDTHRVRTHTETLMLIVDADKKIRRVEVLAFEEPLEYMPKDQWYGKFEKSPLDAELEVKRRIPFVTGASLTAQASVQAARRILAIHEVLENHTVRP